MEKTASPRATEVVAVCHQAMERTMFRRLISRRVTRQTCRSHVTRAHLPHIRSKMMQATHMSSFRQRQTEEYKKTYMHELQEGREEVEAATLM